MVENPRSVEDVFTKWSNMPSLHPQPAPLFPPYRTLGLVFLIIVLTLLLSLKFQKYWKGIVGTIIILGCYVVFVVHLVGKVDEEPFAFFEGVSLWPTDFIRLAGVLLAVAYLVYVGKKLSKDWNKIKTTFKIDSNEVLPEEKESARAPYSKLKRFWKIMWGTFFENKDEKRAQSMVWIPYSKQTFWWELF